MRTQRRLQADAYLTVYLSLIMPVILGLIFALLFGARVGAVRMKSELSADIAVNSVLGEYNKELFDRYSLLLIDNSFGTRSGNARNIEEHLSRYFTKNFELSPIGTVTRRSTGMNARLDEAAITGFSLAGDGDGAVLRRQILAYMEAEPIEAMAGKVRDNVRELQDNGYDSFDVEDLAGQNQQEMSETYKIDTDNDGDEEELSADNPAGNVASKKGIGVLPLAAPDFDSLSSAGVNADNYISHRNKDMGTGLDESEPDGVLARALVDEYMFEKCGFYGNERDDTVLKYELEYIYGGKDSDYANLNKVVNTLFFWREASNFIHIINDPVKMEEAAALALTASILLVVPELEEAIRMAIVFSWVFAETISDLRILLSGGKVPLVKEASDWKLSIEGMLNFQDNLSDDKGRGLGYEDYLRMLIFMEKEKTKTMRLMDIMEMNVRQSEGNSNFRMDHCVDIFRVNFRVSGKYAKNYEIERVIGYEAD